MKLVQLAPGLWRWEAPHPEWEPDAEPGSAADWPELVGSVAFEADGTLALVDPLVPDGGWAELDRLAHGRRVHVLTTIPWHRRSRAAVADRYRAETTNARRSLPAGVESIVVPDAGERIFWLPGPRALVPGDRILGAGDGGLRVCPETWLRYLGGKTSRDRLRDVLRHLLLPLRVEMVLVSHGRPVLAGGHEALARALSG